MSLKLSCTIAEVISMVSGQVSASLDHSFLLENIASLEKAGPRDIGIVFDKDSSGVFQEVSDDTIQNSKAALLLTSRSIKGDDRCLIVPDALAAYDILVCFARKAARSSVSQQGAAAIDPTAFVADSARIGDGSIIGPQVVIAHDVIIGERVIVHAGAKILDGTQIGSDSIIHAGAVIGSDGYRYIATKTGMRKVPQIGIVRIGRGVEIGANCCIDRAGFHQTVLEDGVKLDNLVHIAHNVHVGAHTAIIAQTGIAGGARIGFGCQIGGQVAIKDHVTIGNNVKIVSKSAVLKDIADNAIVAGIPAMPFTRWKRLSVIMASLPELSTSVKKMQQQASGGKIARWWHRLFGR